MWFGQGGYIISSKKNSEKAKHLRMCPSISGNVGETWLRQGLIITPPLPEGRYFEKTCRPKKAHEMHAARILHNRGLLGLNQWYFRLWLMAHQTVQLNISKMVTLSTECANLCACTCTVPGHRWWGGSGWTHSQGNTAGDTGELQHKLSLWNQRKAAVLSSIAKYYYRCNNIKRGTLGMPLDIHRGKLIWLFGQHVYQ